MKKIAIYIILEVILITQYACKKDLNALPENSKTDVITIVDQSTAQIALNGAYYLLAGATNTKANWQPHEVFPGTWAGFLGYGYGSGGYDEENINDRSSYS